jgi:ATP-dependent DNA helicase RecG
VAESKGFLSQDIEFLKGVGPVRGEVLRSELAIHSFKDLLFHFPFRYLDKSQIQNIADIGIYGEQIQLKGSLIELREVRGKKKRLEGYLSDGTGTVKLVWFQKINWVQKSLVTGHEYLAFGRVNNFKGQISIPHPEMERSDVLKKIHSGGLEPVYSTTEKLSRLGLDAKGIRKLVYNLFERLSPTTVEESLPEYLIAKLKLCTKYQALRWIHLPQNSGELEKARLRLKFEELFLIQLKILHRRKAFESAIKGNTFSIVGDFFNTFFKSHLRFELTSAQKRVLKEIRADLGSGHQMNRLLQGDVGSGKTVVSVMTMLLALDNGFQSCLLAPTEVLARQHYLSVKELLEPMGITIAFLSGSVKGKERKVILQDLSEGVIQILIGTHALLEPPVIFKNLGMAITDEQHRFGVKQRAALWKKGKEVPPHILVMTATPIPRTLAMTIYGDLKVSIIDEMPPGRKDILTMHKRDNHRMQLIEFMRQQIARGRQIFVVYPLIEESATLDMQNLMDGYEQLLEYFPLPEFKIAVVHGRLSSQEKDAEMARFVRGTAQIMVATTVIEVGVNIPNATVMVIENAERFGLSQLHQLRGRVGRGDNQSYCILMTGNKMTKEAIKRMNTMVRTNDGFEIAEVDLEIRGPGDIEGTQQSGILELKVANLIRDVKITETARNIVMNILDKDPKLTLPQHITLYRYLAIANKDVIWGKIG